MIEVEYETNGQEAIQATLLVLKRHPWRFSRVFFSCSMLLIFGVYIVFFDYLTPAFMGYLAIIYSVALFFMGFFNTARALRFGLTGEGNEDQITLTLTPEGIRSRDELVEHYFKWEAFATYLEDSDSLLLFTTKTAFFYVPKRVFNAEQRRELRQYLYKIGTRPTTDAPIAKP